MRSLKSNIKKKFVIIPFILFSILLILRINYPYVGQNAYNSIIYSLIGHNYVQFGYFETRLSSIVSVSKSLPLNPEYFFHHPPLISIVESISISLLGDGFWQGRLPVIFFAFGTLVFTFLIARLLWDKKSAIIAASIYVLVPAASIFGKMIGQETLVLFFLMATTFFSLKFLKTKKNGFLVLGITSMIFATLSDWPAIYFSIFILPIFIKYKRIRQGFLLPLASISTAVVLAVWISWIRGGLWDIQNAILLRSAVGLFSVSILWPVFWLSALILRLILYFNPVFLFFAGVSLYGSYKLFIKKKLNDSSIIILIFFVFGFFHVALYTQAFFTHPYLAYYILPFVVFGSVEPISKIIKNKNRLLILILLILSSLYLYIVFTVKENQIKSNVWRYELANYANNYLKPYEAIIYNKFYAIDPDIWRYPLLINPVRQDENNSPEFLNKFDHYIYSCDASCYPFKGWVDPLKARYKYVKVSSKQAEMYIFFLKNVQTGNNKAVNIKTTYVKEDWLVTLYRNVRDALRAPQL